MWLKAVRRMYSFSAIPSPATTTPTQNPSQRIKKQHRKKNPTKFHPPRTNDRTTNYAPSSTTRSQKSHPLIPLYPTSVAENGTCRRRRCKTYIYTHFRVRRLLLLPSNPSPGVSMTGAFVGVASRPGFQCRELLHDALFIHLLPKRTNFVTHSQYPIR